MKVRCSPREIALLRRFKKILQLVEFHRKKRP
jgi:hypothetical protein